MKAEVLPGKYILAVSGGVDSMALLDMLAKEPTIELVVAHFNHNIREDSALDEELVRDAATYYGLVFESGSARLGKTASEAAAREARYDFLKRLRVKYEAKAIITAHHQDDLIETALINLIRGSGRKGLSAIADNKQILRPLLNTPKSKIRDYAVKNGLDWREDSTNQDLDYLRNYLRLSVLPGLNGSQRQSLISNLDKVAKTSADLDIRIATLSHIINRNNQINRQLFSSLPTNVGNELMAHLLREAEVADFDSKTVNRLSMAIKTSKPNSIHPIKQNSSLKVGAETASLITP